MGGSQQMGTQSIVILRPVAALLCGYGLWALKPGQVAQYRYLFGLLAAAAGLCVLHLIPLPPKIWHVLPGRALVTEIDQAAGLDGIWRPIAMVPYAARNALFSLLIPTATLLLAIGLDKRERAALLPWLIGIGMVSGVIGLLQVLGPTDGPLYFYRVTNEGWAVGLFANRNHAAVFLACLFPMLAVFASQPAANLHRAQFRLWLAMAGGLVLVPMIVASGSRAALLIMIMGLAVLPAIYRKPHLLHGRDSRPVRRLRKRLPYIVAAIVTVTLLLIALMFSRTSALDRLAVGAVSGDMRTQVWGKIFADVWRYFPIGSGVGSFIEVYQIHEPDAALQPTYLNHAHNELLEVALTTGLPGLLLLAAVLIGWARASFCAWRAHADQPGVQFGRMASIVLLMLFFASIPDYPLRTPSLACFATIAALWLAESARGEASKRVDASTAALIREV
jgi:O-antigen ligase